MNKTSHIFKNILCSAIDAPGHLFSYNTDFIYTDCNQNVADYHSLKYAEDIIGLTVYDLLLLEDVASIYLKLNQTAILDHKAIKGISLLPDKKGNPISLLSTVKPYYNKTTNSIAGIVGQAIELDANIFMILS